MDIGNVKRAPAAYQGSGLETSAGQKAAPEVKAAAPEVKKTVPETKKTAPEVKMADPVSGSVTEKKEMPENPILEVQEPNRNDTVRRAVEQLNRKAKNSEAIFGIHDETNRVTIKIVDKETKEVIREFPPEETLDMIAKVWELAGLMVDEKR